LAAQLIAAIFFFSGRPAVTTDYLAQMNKPALAVPVDQQAWPLYRDAIIATRDWNPPPAPASDDDSNIQPGERRWPWVVAWMHAHAPAIEEARQAANKPALGFIYGPTGSLNDIALPVESNLAHAATDWPLTALRPAMFVNSPLVQLGFRLRSDATLAHWQKDSSRFVADVEAILGIADHLRDQGFFDASGDGIFLSGLAMRQIDDCLSTDPAFLTNENLQALAHRIARIGQTPPLFNLKSERLVFLDRLQRYYTDDGSGSGRLTANGLEFVSAPGDEPLWFGYDLATKCTFGPPIMVATDSRAQSLADFDQLNQLMESDFSTPLRQAPASQAEQFIAQLRQSFAGRARHCCFLDFVDEYYFGWGYAKPRPFVSSYRRYAEMLLGQRDGIEAGLAIEMYRRLHGQYPQALNDLVPSLLPSVPADRITGDPVKYRLLGGKPVVYSVGVDRKDDGGTPPMILIHPEYSDAARWPQPGEENAKIPSGDWILYPAPVDDN
jgi:hypothetical protein